MLCTATHVGRVSTGEAGAAPLRTAVVAAAAGTPPAVRWCFARGFK